MPEVEIRVLMVVVGTFRFWWSNFKFFLFFDYGERKFKKKREKKQEEEEDVLCLFVYVLCKRVVIFSLF